MNNQRRKELAKTSKFAFNILHNINTSQNKYDIINELKELVDRLKDIQLEEEYYMYNIPDNLQNGSRYDIAEEACDNMETAISYLLDSIEDAECTLEEIKNTLELSIKYIDLASS